MDFTPLPWFLAGARFFGHEFLISEAKFTFSIEKWCIFDFFVALFLTFLIFFGKQFWIYFKNGVSNRTKMSMKIHIWQNFWNIFMFWPLRIPFLNFLKKILNFLLTYGVLIPTKLPMDNLFLTLFLKIFHFLTSLVGFFAKMGTKTAKKENFWKMMSVLNSPLPIL